MTTLCWEGEPAERPTVDFVLESLEIAAELWESDHGGFSAQPTLDDWNKALSTAESDSPTCSSEPEDGHLPIDALLSCNPFQRPAAKKPVSNGPFSAPPSSCPTSDNRV